MPDQDYFTWNGRRVWLLTTPASTHRICGTIVRVAYAPVNRDEIDVFVQLDRDGVSIIHAAACAREWDFDPRFEPGSVPGGGTPEAKSA